MSFKRLTIPTSVLLAVCLLAAACSDNVSPPGLGDGSLGAVTVDADHTVHIWAINSFDRTDAGARDYLDAVELAVADYGPIHGEYAVELSGMIHDPCSADFGQQAADFVVGDSRAVGVIGPSCSVTATTAGPPITAAGLVMISMSNTSPQLTSDLDGNPGEHHLAGYYRTAHNDLYQGEAVAAFLHDTLGPQEVAVVHEGDAYTGGLAQAFRGAFERHGGTVTHYIEIDVDLDLDDPATFEATHDDLAEVLDQIAADKPDAIFFPLYQATAAEFLVVLRELGEFDEVLLISADGVLHDAFMQLEVSRGIYISGPDLNYGDNVNQATGMSADQVASSFAAKAGAPPVRAFWAHTYDATTLLLDAITAASSTEGGRLEIDRAGIRQYLNEVAGYQGLIGEITCDRFGDCGTGAISVIEHLDPENFAASWDNVVYRFSP